MNRRYQLTITSPNGTEFDASQYIDIGAMGSVSSEPEEDLSILSHSNLALSLDNSGGEVEAFFESAQPTDVYEVILRRETDDGTFERVFGGVLDMPYSLQYDDMARTAKLIAYSYTKLLERTPADTIVRTLALKTASITAATSQIVFLTGEASDLEIGDVVRLSDGTNVEDFTVSRKIDASNVTTTQAAGNGFSSALCQVMTPFYHDISPAALLTLISDEAGVELEDRITSTTIADFPIATPLSIADLHLNADVGTEPLSLVPATTTLVSSWTSAFGTTRKVLDAPDGTWTAGSVTNIGEYDWTPYFKTEPTHDNLVSGASYDTGVAARDFAGNVRYRSTDRELFANEVSQGFFNVDGLSGNFIRSIVDFDPTSGFVFWTGVDETGDGSFQYWNGAFTTIASGVGGALRVIRYFNVNRIVFVVYPTNELRFYSGTSLALVHSLAWGNSTDNVLHWTMRTWGVGPQVGGIDGELWLSVLFERYHETWVRIYKASGLITEWEFAAEYRISSQSSYRTPAAANSSNTVRSYQTVMTLASGEQVAVGYAGGIWFVLATNYAGVVRYADFSDASCAKAARDVAIILGGAVDFSPHRVMTVVNRKSLDDGEVIADLGVPLTNARRPISEFYRASVAVTGTDANGDDINEVQGEAGDSARRVQIDSDLVTTPGMALACALATLPFVSQIRSQCDVSINDPGVSLRVFSNVTMGDRQWLIYRLDSDLEQETHQLTLLEVV